MLGAHLLSYVYMNDQTYSKKTALTENKVYFKQTIVKLPTQTTDTQQLFFLLYSCELNYNKHIMLLKLKGGAY